jgi:CBS domain containing-hemolysin-like protein
MLVDQLLDLTSKAASKVAQEKLHAGCQLRYDEKADQRDKGDQEQKCEDHAHGAAGFLPQDLLRSREINALQKSHEQIDYVGDAKAKDVMVPRVNVIFADVDSTYKELIELFREHKFTRLPVYEETTDNVIGTINMKDLLLYDNTEEFQIREFLRDAYFTYEHKNISELLVEMREASYNIAIVLDEYGETAGLITLEDILEEIVGEIHDEYDEYEEDELLTCINDFEYILEGSISLDDLDDRLELKLESEEYDSLGGFIIERLDRHPEVGDEIVTESGLRLVVDSLDKNRVEKVHIYIPEDFYEEEDNEDEDEE